MSKKKKLKPLTKKEEEEIDKELNKLLTQLTIIGLNLPIIK